MAKSGKKSADKSVKASKSSKSSKSVTAGVQDAVAPASTDIGSISELLRVNPGSKFDLASVDPGSTPGCSLKRKDVVKLQPELGARLADLQERLFAEGKADGTRSVLLVLQGMDTSGKGGTARHVLGQVDPQGVTITSFGVPTEEEKAHDFLWRVQLKVPRPGIIGMFDRSHYEDVVVVRVHDIVPRATWVRRFARINRWEGTLAAQGTRVLKVFLHISPEESRARLLERLDDPTKLWKFKPHDIDERAFWGDYRVAYSDAISRCSTALNPWYVVPADHKWYRDYAVTRLLVEHLEQMDPQWPTPDFDIAAQRARLTGSAPD